MRSFTDTNVLAASLAALAFGVLLNLRATTTTLNWLGGYGRWLLRLTADCLRVLF